MLNFNVNLISAFNRFRSFKVNKTIVSLVFSLILFSAFLYADIYTDGDLTVDDYVLFVNGTDVRVGINNSCPNSTLDITGNLSVSANIHAASYTGDGSSLTGVVATLPSVNLTTSFGGEVTGTYDAMVLQWLTSEWFDNELNQSSSPTFNAITASTYNGVPSVNITSSFGGEATGTYDNIVLQWLTSDWFDNELNQTSAPTFANINTGQGAVEAYAMDQPVQTSDSPTFASLTLNGNLTIIGAYLNATVTNQYLNGSFLPDLDNTFDIGSSSKTWANVYVNTLVASAYSGVPSINITTNFAGDVTGTYGATVVGDDSHNHVIANIDEISSGVGSEDMEAAEDFGDFTCDGTDGGCTLDETYLTATENVTGNLTVSGDILANAYYGDGSNLANLPAGSTPSVNLTTNFGGDASGTYDALVIPMKNITGNFTITENLDVGGYIYGDGSKIANLPAGSTPSVNLTTNFGGEVSGAYNAIVLDHDALDDQYYDSESDLTALLDDNYLATMQNITGNLTITGDMLANSYYGDGSSLTGIATSMSNITGNFTVTGNVQTDSFYYINHSRLNSSHILDHDGHTIEDMFDHIVNRGKVDSVTIILTGGLGINWTSGEVYDETSHAFLQFDSGNGNVANNQVNYLKWVGTNTLQISTSTSSGTDILIATFSVYDNKISSFREHSIISNSISNTRTGLRVAFPTRVISGMCISEDEDATNSLDVNMSSGQLVKDGIEIKNPGIISSRTINLIRHYHTAGAWDSDTNAEIDTVNYDNGTDRIAIPANKWVKSYFIFMNGTIGWVYPNAYYNNEAQALAASLSPIPPGLAPIPKMTAIVYQASDADFTSTTWQDIRAGISEESFNIVTDHGSLAGLNDNDHPQYILDADPFGGEVTGTYDAIVLQWLTSDWFDNELNQSSSPTFNAITASTYNGVPSVNLTTNFGGEVSGTYNAIVLDHDALDDQYYDSEGDLTGLLDDNYLAATQNVTGNFSVTGDILANAYYGDGSHLTGIASSVDSVNITTEFGGGVMGTYDAIVLQWLTSDYFNQGLNTTNDVTFNSISGDGSGLTGVTADWLTSDYFNQNLNTTNAVTFSSLSLNSALTVANGGTGAQTFTDGGILFGDGVGDIDVSAQLPAGAQLIGIVEGTNPALVVTFTAHDGYLKHEFGGMEANVAGYTNGLYGQVAGSTVNVDTLAELNTVITDASFYSMDQNVSTGEDVTFNSISGDGSGLTGVSASVPSVNITTTFGGDVTGTYGATVVHTPGVNITTNFGGDVTGTYGATVVGDDSHNHVIANIDEISSGVGSEDMEAAEDFGDFTCDGNDAGCTMDDGVLNDEFIELADTFGGEVTGTYDALVLQWLTSDWFDNELNQSSSPTFNTITASTYNGMPSVNITTNLVGDVTGPYSATVVHTPGVNITTNFGGEVSGTYNAIVLNHDALDDQYYDSESDLTTLLDDNYEGELNNEAGLYSALSDVTQFWENGDSVTGAIGANEVWGVGWDGDTSVPEKDDIYDWASGVTTTEMDYLQGVTSDIQTQINGVSFEWLTSDYFNQNLNTTNDVTFNSVSGDGSGLTGVSASVPSVNLTTNFGGDASGTYGALVVPPQNITGNFSVTKSIHYSESSGKVQTYNQGCYMESNSTGLYWHC